MRRIDWLYAAKQFVFLIGLLIVLHGMWSICAPIATVVAGLIVCAVAAYQPGRKRG